MVDGLLDHGLELTDKVTECPGVLPPDVVQLVGHGQDQGGQVGQGEVDQVLVCRSPRRYANI